MSANFSFRATLSVQRPIGCVISLLLAAVMLVAVPPGASAHPHKTKCVARHHHRAPAKCRHADGAPRHKVHGFRVKHHGHTGAGGVPDQYLPWANGQTIRLSQGNQSPCGWSHAPPRCNAIGAYTQYGWDFELPYRAPVHAAAAGTVLIAKGGCNPAHSYGCNGGYGNTITIEVPAGNCERYEHLSRVDVRQGQSVSGYDVIGAVGNSGNSGGTHLHYQREVCSGHYAGIGIPSSFIEAGVPRTGQRVTSQNRPGGQIAPMYHVLGPASGLDVHSGPGTNFSVISHLAVNSVVTVVCQTRGNTVGNSSIWDSIGSGAFVPDFYISTPADGAFSPGIPPCGAGLPPLDGGAHNTSFEGDDPFGRLESSSNQAIYCGNGLAHHGNCYLETNASAPGHSFVEDFAHSTSPGQCLSLSGWFRSPSGAGISGVWAIWVRNFQSDQSASTPFTVGGSWTPVTVVMRAPNPPSGPPWSALRGQLYINTPNQNIDWDLVQWYGPYAC